jgi:hypothetical protein
MTIVYRPRPTPTPAPPEMSSVTLDWLKGQGQQRANGVIDALSTSEAERLGYDWDFLARPDQLPPAGNWSVWLYLAGRGSGKTRAGVEWVRRKIKQGSRRIALIAPTTSAARDVLIEGESGILAHAWEHDRDDLGNIMGRPVYEPSKRRLTWGNGAIATAFSAEEPDRLRGPQHDCILADELAAWSKVKSATAADPVQSSYAWDMAMMGLRIGRRPQVMVATTPRPIPILRELMRSPACAVTRATTFANRANLAPAFFEHIISKYRGTRLGRQELMGDILEEAVDAGDGRASAGRQDFTSCARCGRDRSRSQCQPVEFTNWNCCCSARPRWARLRARRSLGTFLARWVGTRSGRRLSLLQGRPHCCRRKPGRGPRPPHAVNRSRERADLDRARKSQQAG